MADSKKYNGSTWEHSLRKLATATDTFTTLPVDVYADGNNATVSLKGNTTQSGTPTPESPIMPQGCGERTENLYDYSTIVPGYTYNSNGQMILNPDEANRWRYAAVPLIEVESGATYRRTYDLLPWGNTINFYDSNKNFLERATPGSGMPVTVPSNCKFVSFVFQTANSDVKKYMFTRGSTVPSEFIPFGYKIPISSASTTTPVYLGEVQSTRRIKKLVLTGEESYDYQSQYSRYIFTVMDAFAEDTRKTQCFCSHYQSVHNGEPIDDVPNNSIYINQQKAGTQFCIKTESITSAADFKTYLAQQYAAGTPVTIWYVLATETTGIVNEPLRKIGDYADEVSGITIPTITGKDTFDVETALKPSEATLSYTGWHDATVEEWDGSEWQ